MEILEDKRYWWNMEYAREGFIYKKITGRKPPPRNPLVLYIIREIELEKLHPELYKEQNEKIQMFNHPQ